MKKVGIITYHYYYNYGTMLQAFALQNYIQKQNNNCELIDYRVAEKKITKLNLLLIRLKRVFHYLNNLKKVYRYTVFRKKINQKHIFFKQFAEKYFNLTEQSYMYYCDLINNKPIKDIYIVGSDQTWSPKIGLNPAFFLEFAPKNSIKASYAPSIGVTKFDEISKEAISKYLNKFNFISCRETIGSQLLQQFTEKPIYTVLDPTFLLTADDWGKFSVNPIIKKPYILCYFLGNRKYYRTYVKELGKITKMEIYYIPVNYMDLSKKNNLLFNCGPSEFLGLIKNASIICTDSFHGMAFSINYNKDFYVFTKCKGSFSDGDNSRIYDLLNRMNLLDRLKTPKDNVVFGPIEYSNVNEKLAKERKNSTKYLQNILN